MSHMQISSEVLLNLCKAAKAGIEKQWLENNRINRVNALQRYKMLRMYREIGAEEEADVLRKLDAEEGIEGYKDDFHYRKVDMFESAAKICSVIFLDMEDFRTLDYWSK